MAPEWLLAAFAAWGRGHARSRILRDLDGLHVQWLERLRAQLATGPLILAANHVGWWDGVLMVHLNEVLGLQSRVLMEERQLRVYPWFRAYGAMPLRRGAQAEQDLQAAAMTLTGPNTAVWIFPQGRHTPVDLRPMGLKPGVAQLAQAAGCPVVPVSLAYHYLQAPCPAAFVQFGEPIPPGPDLLPALEERLLSGLQGISGGLALGQRWGEPLLPAPARSGLGAAAMKFIWRLFAGREHA